VLYYIYVENCRYLIKSIFYQKLPKHFSQNSNVVKNVKIKNYTDIIYIFVRTTYRYGHKIDLKIKSRNH
jgi:hypothetical protein